MVTAEAMAGPEAWRGEDLARSTDWIREIPPALVQELEAAQRVPGVPPLTAAQNEALDLLAEVAEEQCFRMTLEPGDIQFLNNHVVYHGRTAYEDGDGADSDRLLYRLWLSMPNSRGLPPGFEVLWGNIEPGALRGGIEQPASTQP